MSELKAFFDTATNTLTYVVWDAKTRDAVVVDPVLDFDAASGVISDESFKKLKSFLDENKLMPHVVLETHAHADHLSCAHLVKEKYPGCVVGIGEKITEVQKTFAKILDLEDFR